tara:strand:+ start:154 stop:459 length:306 start_codon:yes stop_codon:yes gene_type:complete
MSLPNWLLLWIQQSLIGEVYPEIRAIVLRYDSDRTLLLRYYFDRDPTEDDLENIECVMTNIFAHTSSGDQIKNAEVEAIFSKEKIGNLDCLDGLIYARKES